jgi:hypothetical protein
VDPPRTGHLAVALSGGGHRATLFALGALLALVDRGLNRDVAQISSVSGGSIANAFIAQRCHFDRLEPGDLDPVAAELIGTIVERGVLTPRWIVAIIGCSIGAGVASGALLWFVGVPAVVIPFVSLVVAFGLLLTSGLVVQRLLDRRYFRPAGATGKLGALADRTVEHTFCSTDLVLGQPVYFSSWGGGSAWRRTARSGGISAGLRYGADSLSLAEVVRASSAFPGIPPLRLRVDAKLGPVRRPRRDADGAGRRRPPGTLFLADGGLWNNLGSHVLREDGMVRGAEGAGREMVLLCVNSSAASAASAPATYSIPVVAQFAALFRTLRVLTVNTVQPRVDAVAEAMARRNAAGTRPGPLDPLDIVVDLASVRRHEVSIRALCRDRDQLRRSDPVHDRYHRDVVEHLAAWAASVAGGPSATDSARLTALVHDALADRPEGTPEGIGLLDVEILDDLDAQGWWTTLRSHTGPENLTVRTTLDRVDRDNAAELVLRGYANTWLSSMLVDSRGGGSTPPPPAADIVARVHRMVGHA